MKCRLEVRVEKTHYKAAPNPILAISGPILVLPNKPGLLLTFNFCNVAVVALAGASPTRALKQTQPTK